MEQIARDKMLTMRMVAETKNGLCCIDVTLRASPAAIDEVAPIIRKFLDFDIGYGGAWVDGGTDRTEYTVAVV